MRRARARGTTWALSLALVVATLPRPLAAQAGESPAALARAAAAAWERQDARALEALLAPDGITLRLEDQMHSGVGARQARASLEAFIGRHAAGETRVLRASELGGDPPKGLVELEWHTAPRGSAEEKRYVIFFGLERVTDEWRIAEVRIMP